MIIVEDKKIKAPTDHSVLC